MIYAEMVNYDDMQLYYIVSYRQQEPLWRMMGCYHHRKKFQLLMCVHVVYAVCSVCIWKKKKKVAVLPSKAKFNTLSEKVSPLFPDSTKDFDVALSPGATKPRRAFQSSG